MTRLFVKWLPLSFRILAMQGFALFAQAAPGAPPGGVPSPETGAPSVGPSAVKFLEEMSGHQGIQPYTQPGIVSYKAGKWIGNDHLYNLSSDIRVVAETFKPEGVSVDITGESLRSRAEGILRKTGINPFAPATSAQTVLPFLHIMVVIYPVEGGGSYATSINVRLFESVDLSRVKLEGGVAWQGITWEKQKLVIAKKDQVVDAVNAALDDMLNDFVKRYLFYKKLQSYLQSQKPG